MLIAFKLVKRLCRIIKRVSKTRGWRWNNNDVYVYLYTLQINLNIKGWFLQCLVKDGLAFYPSVLTNQLESVGISDGFGGIFLVRRLSPNHDHVSLHSPVITKIKLNKNNYNCIVNTSRGTPNMVTYGRTIHYNDFLYYSLLNEVIFKMQQKIIIINNAIPYPEIATEPDIIRSKSHISRHSVSLCFITSK